MMIFPGVNSRPSLRTQARSSTLFSSRTLPGHRWACNTLRAAGKFADARALIEPALAQAEHETGAAMLPKNRIPTHPGEILLEEFLNPLGLTQVALAKHLGVSVQRINELVKGKRGVSPETAWLLAQAFGTTPEFWINLQTAHDLARVRPTHKVRALRRSG